jgi:DNA adenine methylase
MHATAPARVTPLLKWAGGKRQLLMTLSDYYPARFTRYLEPFLGSGAVFFDLLSRQRLERCAVRLSDVNPDLIGCYRTLRDAPEAVIGALEALADEHRQRGDACYYDVRDERFNPMRAALARHGRVDPEAYTPPLAAMLIFLNRTGFNGLFRLNRQGGFNVPAGRYTSPRICDASHLRAVSEVFRRPGISLVHRPFHDALEEAASGDFVYCDPPYEPLSRTSSFASYTADGFTMSDQRRLQQAVVSACRRGAVVVVSNSSAPGILDTYGTAEARRAGLRIRRVPARRAINSQAASRGAVDELLISNVKLRMAKAALGTGVAAARAAGPRRAGMLG